MIQLCSWAHQAQRRSGGLCTAEMVPSQTRKRLFIPRRVMDCCNVEAVTLFRPRSLSLGRGSGTPSVSLPTRQSETTPHPPTVSLIQEEDNTGKGNGGRERKRRRVERGSYQRYYGYRQDPGAGTTDVRLSLFEDVWFRGKVYVDIGCNTGKVVWEVFRTFEPATVVGIDIDAALIQAANEKLAAASAKDGKAYEDVIKFRCEDFVAGAEGDGSAITHCYLCDGTFDVITCLSVTKWVHLHKGDDAVKGLFARAYGLLRPGGRFVLEAQPWKSYRKARYVSEETARRFKEITFKPERFMRHLLDVVGFDAVEELGVPDGARGGFKDRPILCFVKKKDGSGVCYAFRYISLSCSRCFEPMDVS